MKKAPSAKRKKDEADDLKPEYRFDYRKAQPNRFAAKFKVGSRLVLLDPDVAEVFTTPESVNAVLRALLETMPRKGSGLPRIVLAFFLLHGRSVRPGKQGNHDDHA